MARDDALVTSFLRHMLSHPVMAPWIAADAPLVDGTLDQYLVSATALATSDVDVTALPPPFGGAPARSTAAAGAGVGGDKGGDGGGDNSATSEAADAEAEREALSEAQAAFQLAFAEWVGGADDGIDAVLHDRDDANEEGRGKGTGDGDGDGGVVATVSGRKRRR